MSTATGFDRFCRRANQYPMLSADEEATLVTAIRRCLVSEPGQVETAEQRRIRRSAKQAEEVIVHAHLRLVLALARPYCRPGVDLDDLVQEGNLALINSISPYLTRGQGRFATYARGRVRAAIAKEANRADHTVKVPERVAANVRLYRRTVTELESLGRQAEGREVQDRRGMTPEQLKEIERLSMPTARLSTPVGDGSLALEDTLFHRSELEVFAQLQAQAAAEEILRSVNALPYGFRQALCLRLGITSATVRVQRGVPTTFDGIAKTMGVSTETARRYYAHALAMMRHPSWGTSPFLMIALADEESTEPDQVGCWLVRGINIGGVDDAD